jgi:hypothetical protein
VERNIYDPFQEPAADEADSGSSAAGPRGARKREEEESPYWVVWSVVRSILEILVDVVI